MLFRSGALPDAALEVHVGPLTLVVIREAEETVAQWETEAWCWPVEVVEALHRLDRSREPQPQLYAEVLGFLAGIPEGLVPGFFARKLGACRNDTTRRMVLAQLPVENFCALRLLATWSTRNGAQCDVAALLQASRDLDGLVGPDASRHSERHERHDDLYSFSLTGG